MKTWRRLVAAIVIVVAALSGSVSVSAHADLVQTTPANQAVLDQSPPEIVLTFSEAIDPVEPAVRVVDADGNEIDLGSADQSRGSDTLGLVVDEELADGTYVVAWQALSADSHNIRGAFTFSVGEASATRSGLVDELFTSSNESPGGAVPLAIGRFASYAGIAVLLGGLFAATVLARPQLSTRRVGRLLFLGLGTAAVGTAMMISAQANMIGSSLLDWPTVAATRSGQWWVLRLAAILAFVPFVVWRHRLLSRIGGTVTVAAGLGLLAIVTAGGHGVTGRWVPIGYAATVAHLAAMTIWVGGLTLLVIGLPRTRFWETANRFSPWALGSVVVLAVSGTINAWRQIGSLDGITDSSYGRWLIVKLALVTGVVATAAITRRLLHRGEVSSSANVPALSAAPGPTSPDPESSTSTATRTSVIVELVGIILVIAATSGLVNSPPPELDQPTNEIVSVVQGDRVAQVELEPAVTGGTVMHVTITSPGGGLDRADEITVTAELAADQIGPIEIETIPASPNHVIANNADFPVAGLWTIEITARYGEFDQVVFSIDIPVET
ncbi:copper resistance CopC/CopD family protein [Ilumatobacter nonamiensis]|uniref:copper resistance CopC/CopD family protein n=1 Tax=Ilumatobacter nonamiensis TaxID=467093 RepID=UPI000349B436|nr:copper resistance protein CopC [Ilumatobacter nonamiensis]